MSGSSLPSEFCAVGLHRAKTAANIGSVLRASGCFGVALVAVSGARYRRVGTDTSAAYRSIPLIEVADLHAVVPFDCVPVAVDLVPGARLLPAYSHPRRAFYVFGPEDGTLGKDVLSWCRDAISIPTNGCLNLAGAVHCVLYDRLLKGRKNAWGPL